MRNVMADPLSIAGLVLAIPAVAELLLAYFADTKDAKIEIQRYATDLFSLKGILEYIESISSVQSDNEIYKYESAEFAQLLQATRDTLQDLKMSLELKKSSLGYIMQRMTWSQKKRAVQEYFARLERLKTGFLIVMMGDNLNYGQAILSELSQLNIGVTADREMRESLVADEERAILFGWLVPVRPEPIHNTAYNSHQPNTGAWFLDGPLRAFRECEHNKASVLWLQGKSGSGKTTLLACAIEKLKAEFASVDSVGVAYYYCSFNNLESQRPMNIISSLLVQLCEGNPALYDELKSKFTNSAKNKVPLDSNVGYLKDVFRRHTATLNRLYIVVDAINESEVGEDVKMLLFSLAQTCANVRLLITSTASVDRYWLTEDLQLVDSSMGTEDVDADILVYVNDRIAENRNLKGLSLALQNEIRTAILENSNGVFRYAESQIAHVAKQLTGRDVRKALSQLPHDLNEAYERILRQVKSETTYQTYMQRALRWLCFATRPLTLTELSEAVVIEDDDRDLDPDSRLRDLETLISLGQGLFEYDQDNGHITLSHSSIKTFLTSTYIQDSDVAQFAMDEREAQNTIMRTCLTYLRFEPFRIGCIGDFDAIAFLVSQYPLLPYVAHFWPHHARYARSKQWDWIFEFFCTRMDPYCGNYGFWIRYITGDIPPGVIARTHALYYAASFGYTALISLITTAEMAPDLEQPGGRHGSTALQVACFRRQREAARLLVIAGANPFSPDGSGINHGFSSLFWARENGWNDIVELMIERGTAKGFEFEEKFHGDYAMELVRKVQASAIKHQEEKDHASSGAAWDSSIHATRQWYG